MFDDVDEALDNAGAASPDDLAKATGIAGAALPTILSLATALDPLARIAGFKPDVTPEEWQAYRQAIADYRAKVDADEERPMTDLAVADLPNRFDMDLLKADVSISGEFLCAHTETVRRLLAYVEAVQPVLAMVVEYGAEGKTGNCNGCEVDDAEGPESWSHKPHLPECPVLLARRLLLKEEA